MLCEILVVKKCCGKPKCWGCAVCATGCDVKCSVSNSQVAGQCRSLSWTGLSYTGDGRTQNTTQVGELWSLSHHFCIMVLCFIFTSAKVRSFLPCLSFCCRITQNRGLIFLKFWDVVGFRWEQSIRFCGWFRSFLKLYAGILTVDEPLWLSVDILGVNNELTEKLGHGFTSTYPY